VKSNNIQLYIFSLTREGQPRSHHCSRLLAEEVVDEEMPEYLERTDRRGFGGEKAVNIVRKALGIKSNFGSHSRADWQEFH
jgi:hypothetical protein